MADERRVTFKVEYARMLAPFISTEETRYYLQGIAVFPHDDEGVLLVTTNGHVMGVIHDADGETNGDWICPVTPTMWKAMRPDLRTAWDEDDGKYQYDGRERIPHLIHFIGDVAYLTTAEFVGKKPAQIGKHHVLAEFAPAIDGTFPGWTKTIPSDPAGTRPIPFNARYLSAFAEAGAVRDVLARDPHMTLFTGEEEGPAIVRFGAIPEFIGVIMPVRDEAPTAIPDWLPPSDKPEAA